MSWKRVQRRGSFCLQRGKCIRGVSKLVRNTSLKDSENGHNHWSGESHKKIQHCLLMIFPQKLVLYFLSWFFYNLLKMISTAIFTEASHMLPTDDRDSRKFLCVWDYFQFWKCFFTHLPWSEIHNVQNIL